MKTRLGFVSNSSSSSFIVKKGEEFKNIQDLAVRMMEIRNQDWLYWDGDSTKEKKERLAADLVKLKTLSVDENVCFPTTNYETYIAEEGDYLLVSTCNNHDFYDFADTYLIHDSILSKLDNEIENITKHYDFTHVSTGLKGRPVTYENYNDYIICTTCIEELWRLTDGSIKCPACGKNVEEVEKARVNQEIFWTLRNKVVDVEEYHYNYKEIKGPELSLTFENKTGELKLIFEGKITTDVEEIEVFVKKFQPK
jgi:predicted RNA-binding Zn-ribbon protein involved in translation (DUF1610 family)